MSVEEIYNKIKDDIQIINNFYKINHKKNNLILYFYYNKKNDRIYCYDTLKEFIIEDKMICEIDDKFVTFFYEKDKFKTIRTSKLIKFLDDYGIK